MKIKTMLLMVLSALLLGGCSMANAAAGETMQTMGATAPTGAVISAKEAQTIALDHAGYTDEQVTWLRTEYEIDDGRPQYEVHFHQGAWEYEYEIDAQTGAILSYDRDD